MYETFFDLKRRPFAATPDANCWFHSERYQAAIDELLVCAEQGQGVGIVIAPAGVGKTLLCERLVREIGEPFTSVLLRHATYHSRRSFLQTLLSELAQPYDLPSDQELRLALSPVLRGLGQQGRALVLVVDEAHELSEPLLEELRILADQAQEGRPLVRLILCGQLGLEDKLAHPQLRALNQRVRAHVSVLPLSHAESLDYLDYRITWAGGRTDELFTAEAAEAICHAADGIPRCLNQLADHALLSAYVAEQKPVPAETVHNALEDLQHLPLAWNRRPHADTPTAFESTWPSAQLPVDEDEIDAVDEPAAQVLPADTETTEEATDTAAWSWPNPDSEAQDIQPDAWMPADAGSDVDLPDLAEGEDVWQEELVIDRYTALDAGLEPPEEPDAPLSVEPYVEILTPQQASSEMDAADLYEQSAADLLAGPLSIEDKLELVQQVLEYVNDGPQERVSSEARTPAEPTDVAPSDDQFIDEIHSESPSTPTSLDHVDQTVSAESSPAESHAYETESTRIPAAAAVIEFGPSESEAQSAAASTPKAAPRPIRSLFTLLRLKQQGRL